MKATDTFKTTIKAYLDSRAVNDELFAATYAKEGKNIDDCVNYILNTVQKRLKYSLRLIVLTTEYEKIK